MARLESLIKKREEVAARIKKEQAKLKGDERKRDTRRKVLAGATVLEWVARDSEISQRFKQELEAFLVRDYDRALFGLPPAKKTGTQGGSAPL